MGTKSRKRSKGQDERRLTLLEPILNKFCYATMNYGHEEVIYYVYHRLSDKNSTSKIEQIILSGNLLYDGLYLISDYDIDRVWDVKQKKWIIELYPKRYDLHVGQFGDKLMTETMKDLMEYLVGAKYLSESEFWFYCQTQQKPENMEQIRLIFEPNKKEKEVNEDEYI
jgi:hypothetical protein